MKVNPFKILRTLQSTSKIIFNDKNKFFSLIDKAGKKSIGLSDFDGIRKELNLIFSLCKDYIFGNYRQVSKMSMLKIIGGFLYFLNPVDIVPDFILGIGFLDDLSVLTYVIKNIRKELDKYERWKNTR